MSAKFSRDLLSLGKELLIESDYHKQLSNGLHWAVQASGAERGALILITGKGEWIVETVYNLDRSYFSHPDTSAFCKLISDMVCTGETFFTANVILDPRMSHLNVKELFNQAAIICLPLIDHHTLFGLVYLDCRTNKNAFDRKICISLEKFVQLISLAAFKAFENLHSTDHLFDYELKILPYNGFESIIGNHPAILEILDIINKIADTDATVLIQGESGSGKELIAHALHYKSKRKDKPFIPVNCAAIPEQLLESELFGHVRGAFTGAVANKAGWFEQANGGTIFLDEVNDMSPALQVRLLRILQSGEYARVGSTKISQCAVRVVAAASQDLKELVSKGKFRKEVFYRLNVIDLWVPTLRERMEDIPLLIQHFLKVYGAKYNKNNLHLSQSAESLLVNYSFPGNIRELENIINRAVVLANGPIVEVKHLPKLFHQEYQTSLKTVELKIFKIAKQIAMERFERDYIVNVLKFARGNISLAARHAHIPFANLYAKIKKYGINPHFYKDGGEQATA